MTYQVYKQYGRGDNIFCADFKDQPTAKVYIGEQLGSEASMGVKVVYKIMEFGDVVAEFDANNIPQTPNTQTSQTESSGGKGAGSRPTPLSTVPRPPGMPQTWDKGEDKDKE